jgi:hypothetical protein
MVNVRIRYKVLVSTTEQCLRLLARNNHPHSGISPMIKFTIQDLTPILLYAECILWDIYVLSKVASQ